MSTTDQKVTAAHLRRDAYLYVRQSTLRQVVENTESTQRQYDLRQRAVTLGWATEQVVVIDSDLGQSASSAADRAGFQRLVSDVGLGKAGIVMGLEVSRLARNSTDWHRLLEICALADTLILDEDGLYDPAHFNDRLLLGLKGTMSEAELHVLRARLRGGLLNKARRGELELRLPVGFVQDASGRVVLDPDVEVQECLRRFFRTFRRTGSAGATVKALHEQGLSFPVRPSHGLRKDELAWAPISYSRALDLLHAVRYAGAYAFGQTRQRRDAAGARHTRRLPRQEWTVLIPNAHVGYISWDEYEENQRRLKENAARHGYTGEASPPREGPALLQGIVLCGRCGQRMGVRYHQRHGRREPSYFCCGLRVRWTRTACQHVAGGAVDQAIGELLVAAVNPLALEVALDVQRELEARQEEADCLRRKHVERARYEAELARRRYVQVDPDNRLVAGTLESERNDKLRALTEAQDEYERRRRADEDGLDEQQRQRVLELATDFPRLWHRPTTSHRDRKRILRLLIEDVTLLKGEKLAVHVRFRGGKTQVLELPLPQPAWKGWQTHPEVVAAIDHLLDEHDEASVADILNERGLRSGKGLAFTRKVVQNIRRLYRLRQRHQRLREAGMLTLQEMMEHFDVSAQTIYRWRREGLVQARPCNSKARHLFDPPGATAPKKRDRRRRQAATESPQSPPTARGGAV